MFPQYFDAHEMAALLDVEAKWVWGQKRAGSIKPLFAHEREVYDRAALVKLALILALADVFGPKHGAPRRIVESNAGEVASLVAKLDGAALDAGGVAPLGEIKLTFEAGDCLVEIRPRIVAALRERMAQTTEAA